MTVSQTDIQTNYNAYRLPVDARIAQPLLNMAMACKQAGLPVYLSSGYRSYTDQAANFQRICRNNGVTDGKDANGHYITMPAGCSEHQLALCCDITDVHHEIKNDSIASIPTVQWLGEHCAEYGFILRFPVEKRDITQVMGESWHFRYVGEEAARYITDNDLCLEEFIALYKDI
jgi:D-alanyl-D-alanine carboxypeptidase